MADFNASSFADLDGPVSVTQVPALPTSKVTGLDTSLATKVDLASAQNITGAKTVTGAATITGTIVSVSLTAGVATFNTQAAFPVQVGHVITVTGLSGKDNGVATVALNGTWTVASVASGTSFTAAIPEADCTLTADTGAVVAAPNSMAFANSGGATTLGVNPLANIHHVDDFYEGMLHFRGQSGGYAWKARASDESYPRSLGASMGSVGNIFTAAWIDVGPNYDDNGHPYGITAGNAGDVSFIESHMVSIWPDIAAPAIKVAGTAGSVDNATAFALYNSDAPDGNFFASRWGGQSPIKQAVIWGDGRIDWGPNLGKAPKANRTASLYRSLTTGNLTVAGDSTTNLSSFDLVRSGAAGTGATQLGIGRNIDGSADLTIHATSSTTSATGATFVILTPDGAQDGLAMSSRNFGGAHRAATYAGQLILNSDTANEAIILGSIPGSETLPGLWLGVDPPAQSFSNYCLLQAGSVTTINAHSGGSFAWKVANAGCATLSAGGLYVCNGGVTAGDTIVANALNGLVPVRVGWTGTPGEEPYSGIWFTGSPTLANFAFLTTGANNIVNAPNGGTLQIRIANGGGADFSQTTTALDRAGVGISIAGHKIQYGSAAPVAGAWSVGDVVYNTAPAPSGFIGWVCTTAGSPGTWKTWGAISA